MKVYQRAESPYVVILFYRFFTVADPLALRDAQRALALKWNLKGRMLVAGEGVNATFEGTRANVDGYMAELDADPVYADMIVKESAGTGVAFAKLDIRVRTEIVTLGAGEFDVARETAPTITADALEKLYETDEDFVVLDLRNDYETVVGQFEKTYDPKLGSFRDLPSKLPELAHLKNKKIVAVCTGGIRCEKATCLLKKEGFTDVVQLEDGIHTYMQHYPGKHFKGSLFVFDNRMHTPVVETPDRAVIGQCEYCGEQSEDFYSDDSVRPSLKVICCSSCIAEHRDRLRSCAVS